jgi:hypothetical protein
MRLSATEPLDIRNAAGVNLWGMLGIYPDNCAVRGRAQGADSVEMS